MDHSRAISVPSRSSACDPHKGGSDVGRLPPYLRSPCANEPAGPVNHAQGGCGRAIGRCGVPYEYLHDCNLCSNRHRQRHVDGTGIARRRATVPPFSPGVSQPGSMRPRASKAPMKRIPSRSLLGRRIGVSRWAEARPSYDRTPSRNTRCRIPHPAISFRPPRSNLIGISGPSATPGRRDGQQAILAHGEHPAVSWLLSLRRRLRNGSKRRKKRLSR
jgi:hypothetical protein